MAQTFTEYLTKHGIADPKIRSAKYYHAQVRKQSPGKYKYPDDKSFSHRILIERQGPLFHIEAPDTIGDTQQFSSPGLTDWYVAEFCRLNKLRSH